ncbi:Protein phosphatase 1 regulatory subunit 35 C-terminal [Trinorchestia longiramus]|nr:Protein phosphatase 1 regulatory subunit 35 C-terminal [Trinorchestia longiramus]
MFPCNAPLENVQNQNIAVGPRQESAVQSRGTKKIGTDQNKPSGDADLHHPGLLSTKLLQAQLMKQQNESPDLSLLVQEKAASPATANKIMKKSVNQLNHPGDGQVFKAVRNDIPSEADVRDRLQAQLNLNDQLYRPVNRTKIEGPSLSDWYDPSDYIYSIPCSTLSDVQPPFSSAQSKFLSAQALCNELKVLLPN